MSSSRARIAAALQRIADAPRPDDFLAVGTVHRAGEPITWEERISFDRGDLQAYSLLRSPVDAGGAPIGTWVSRAEETRTQPLAQTLCNLAIWRREGATEVMPGMDLYSVTCVTRDGVLDLVFDAMSPEAAELQPLDDQLRAIAEAVRRGGFGASLRLEMRLQRAEDDQWDAHCWMVNEAKRPCIIVNPFVGEPGTSLFFRFETSPLFPEEHGVTRPEAPFEPVVPPGDAARLPDPWQDEYVLLPPHSPLRLPVSPRLGPYRDGPRLVRATYSNYGLLDRMAGLTVIRGQAFSNDQTVTSGS